MTQALSGDAVEKYVRVAYASIYRVVNTMNSNHVSVRDLKIHSIPLGAYMCIQLHCTMKIYTCLLITSFVLTVFESWNDDFQVSPLNVQKKIYVHVADQVDAR